MSLMPTEFAEALRRAAVVPVLTIDDAAVAVPLARALLAGGLDHLEITLRTAASLDAVRQIAREVPEVVVGAGTIRSREQAETATAAGARFLVSPGTTPALLRAALASPVPFLPGAGTVSEAMALAEHGFTVLKLFPAEPLGGVAALKAIAGPLPDMRFCPTGGIGQSGAAAYLALANVVCVGGSWVAPAAAVAARDWARITTLAALASGLRQL